MIKCAKCNHDNPDEAAVCVACGSTLNRPESLKEAATRRLDLLAEPPNAMRWGSIQLGTERKLILHLHGFDEPLIVNLADQVVLGRYNIETGEKPEVDLDPYQAQDLGVSRRHALILLEDGTPKVMDLGSANATYLNGQKLVANQSRILRDGDELRLAKMIVRINFA